MRQFKLGLVLYISFLIILFPKPAHAYLDPGTGSYLFQIAIAGFVGGLVIVKGFWSQIKTFFTELFIKSKPETVTKRKR